MERPGIGVAARPRKPAWFRLKLPTSPEFAGTTALVHDLRLHTVCESAHCPNRWECWSRSTATFMIAGNRCTRACGFCAVNTAKPLPLEADEPARVAEACRRLGLRHVVITMVARDDLRDGAANHVAQTIRAVRQQNPDIIVEVLTSDFNGSPESIHLVLDATPDIFNHNIETVERLTPSVRSRATYRRSLEVLRLAREYAPRMITKSGLMLGLGETGEEIETSLRDLRAVGCDIVTIGQYLQPSPKHLPVVSWIEPEQFNRWGRLASDLGFRSVASGPLVRSSYHADSVDVTSLKSLLNAPPRESESANLMAR
ncbi:MAG TPA: lipoyl synthase [Verrucomicrobiae bacterium]|nr:lipoyl synthase [Verrucomicrobiae bacterium]